MHWLLKLAVIFSVIKSVVNLRNTADERMPYPDIGRQCAILTLSMVGSLIAVYGV